MAGYMDNDKQSGLEKKLEPHEQVYLSTKKFVRNGLIVTSPLFILSEALLGYKTIESFSEGNYDRGIVCILTFAIIGEIGIACLNSYKLLTKQISEYNNNFGGK